MRSLRSDRLLQAMVVLFVVGFGALGVVAPTSDGFAPDGGIALLAVKLVVAWASLVAGSLGNQYADGIPGVLPAEGAPVRTGRPRTVVPVRFAPPDGLRASEIGAVMAGGVDARHVAAALVDLARRGHLRVVSGPAGSSLAPGTTPRDVPSGPEAVLLTAVLGGRTTAYPGSAGKPARSAAPSAALVLRYRLALGREAYTRGWLRSDPVFGDRAALQVGGLAGLLGFWDLALDERTAGWAWPALGWFLVAAVALVRSTWPVGRTALGTALAQQADGFRQYLVTAEVAQLRAEEAAGHLPQYLPFAVAFGLTDCWRREAERLATGSGDDAAMALVALHLAPRGPDSNNPPRA